MNTIPDFPNFRPFTTNDITWYYDLYLAEKLNPYADINPENLYVWLNMNNDLTICKLYSAVILKYTNVLNNNIINIIPLKNPLSNIIIDRITSYLKANDLPAALREVPAVICNELDRSRWLIEDDRDSYEYILDTDQQSILEGSDFSRQRRRVNFFEREHSDDNIDIQYIEEINEKTKEDFIHHINTMPFNSNESTSLQNITEPKAILKNLEYALTFHKKALTISINSSIVAIAMISYLDNNAAAINHLKVDYSVKYIFQYTIYQLAKKLKENGIKEMNIEQDLGIEGLRVFKERLQPSRLLKKVVIRPRYQ